MDPANCSALLGRRRRQPCVSSSRTPSASAYVSSPSLSASRKVQRPPCLDPLTSRISSSPRTLSRFGDKSSVGRCGGSSSSSRRSTGRSSSWTAALLAAVVTFYCRSDRSLFCADAVSTGEYHSCTVFDDGTLKVRKPFFVLPGLFWDGGFDDPRAIRGRLAGVLVRVFFRPCFLPHVTNHCCRIPCLTGCTGMPS